MADPTTVQYTQASVRRIDNAIDTTAATVPTAAAAPSKGANNIFIGLCDALNYYQQVQVQKGHYEVADQYEIEFASAAIGSARVTPPGPVNYKNVAAKAVNTAADKLNPATDSINFTSQTWNVLAGTQIVQLIDQVMRSSQYITSQQLINIDAEGNSTPNPTANTKGVTAWYKISVRAQQLKYDNKRRDHAYRMIFTVSPYAINQMDSPYFPSATYRGAHKAYNYWFTGTNTQILRYEQEYNHAYTTTITGNATGLAEPPPTTRDQRKRTYMATSEQRTQGQPNYVNEPADSAASFLYSISDFAEVNMTILGDPAWMQQGEVSTGVTARTFDFKPFNPDGTINYDSQEVVFTVSFSRPSDYDFATGIVNVNSGSDAPQETFAYIAKTCKNVFSKGQFTQELTGSLLPLPSGGTATAATAADGRPTSPGIVAAAATSLAASLPPGVTSVINAVTTPGGVAAAAEQFVSRGLGEISAWVKSQLPRQPGTGVGDDQYTTVDGNVYKNGVYYRAADIDENSPENAGVFPLPQPAPSPEPPTSSGDITPVNLPAPPDASEIRNTSDVAAVADTTPPQFIAREE